MRGWAFLPAVLLLFFLAEIASFSGAGEPRRHPDTGVYEEVAEAPLFGAGFLAGDKPPTLPLLYKLVVTGQSVVRTQSFLSLACWSFLAFCVARGFERAWARGTAFGLICLFSLTIPVNQWDWVLMSESLTFSFAALLAGLLLLLTGRLRQARSFGRLDWGLGVATFSAGLLFAFARDTNVYILAVAAACFGAWFLVDLARRRFEKARPALLLPAAFLVPALLFGHICMQRSLRWRDPFTNVLLARVVPHPEVYDQWTAQYGMPRNPTFERYKKLKAWRKPWFGDSLRDRFLADDPAVSDIHEWILEDGRGAYARFLLVKNPLVSMKGGLRTLARQANSKASWRFAERAGRKPWAEVLTRWIFPEVEPALAFWAGALLLAAAVAWRSDRGRMLSVFAAVLMLIAWVQAFLAIHGDTSNLPRHAALTGVLFHLGLLFLLLSLMGAVRALGPFVPRVGGAVAPSGPPSRRP